MRRDDRRQSCVCGHRYGVHAPDGTACLAASTDPNQRTGDFCTCKQWTSGPMIDARIAERDRWSAGPVRHRAAKGQP